MYHALSEPCLPAGGDKPDPAQPMTISPGCDSRAESFLYQSDCPFERRGELISNGSFYFLACAQTGKKKKKISLGMKQICRESSGEAERGRLCPQVGFHSWVLKVPEMFAHLCPGGLKHPLYLYI